MGRRPRHPGLHDPRGHELPHRVVEVSGVPTWLVDSGEGPPVLLIHGYGDSADGWRRVVPGLMGAHRVIALDVPPFGRSGKPEAERLIDFYELYFPELFDRLGLDSATVIGHSLGGAIALRLTLARPDLVDRLGLVAPAGLGEGPPWWWHALAGYGLAWRAVLSIPGPLTPLLIRQGLKRFLDWRLCHDPRRMNAEIRHFVEMHGSSDSLERLLEAGRCCIDSYNGELLEESRSIRCPVWMVWGRQDGLVPSTHARSFAEAVPGAEVHVFESCGHYPQMELPGRFNELLGAWLDGTSQDELAEAA